MGNSFLMIHTMAPDQPTMPLIQPTPRAVARVKSLLDESSDSASHLRIHIEVEDADGFKIINPNAHQTCACGKSFTA